MSTDVKSIAEQILKASYSVYSDVSSINNSIKRAGSIYGIEFEATTGIDLSINGIGAVQENAGQIISESGTKHRGFFSFGKHLKTTEVKKENLSENKQVKRIPLGPALNTPIKETLGEKQQPRDMSEGVRAFNAPKNMPTVNTRNKDILQSLKTPALPESPVNKIPPAFKTEAAQPLKPASSAPKIVPPHTLNAAPGISNEKLQSASSASETGIKVKAFPESALKVGQFTLKEETLNRFEQAAAPIRKEVKPSGLGQVKSPVLSSGVKENETTVQSPQSPQINLSSNPVSTLLNLVKSRKDITISEAASEMKVPREYVEKWAKILQQNMLMKIKYEIVGDAKLEA